jgi:DNA-binding response OmpR family regulator
MKRILSIDDDPLILECFQTVLKDKGYEVFITTDPDEVSRQLKSTPYDLVMLDVQMPIKNGFEIFQELKQYYKQIPILFVTAYPQSFSLVSERTAEMWQRDFADGNTDILYKPFHIEDLYEKIEGLIGPAEDHPA